LNSKNKVQTNQRFLLQKRKKYKFMHARPNNKVNNKKQKILFFRQNSKTNNFQKFQSLIFRNNGKFMHRKFKRSIFYDKFQFQHDSSKLFQYKNKQNVCLSNVMHRNCFFSFYPMQFLPFKLSTSSSKVQTNIPTVFINLIQSSIDFSVCEKQATFFNQRLLAFDSMSEKNTLFFTNMPFWLNKQKTNFLCFKQTWLSIWKNFVIKTNLCAARPKSFLEKKNSCI